MQLSSAKILITKGDFTKKIIVQKHQFEIENLIFNIKHQTSNIKHQTSNIKHQPLP